MLKSYPVTPKGLIQIQNRINVIETIDAPKVAKDLQAAKAHGDLSENAEYDIAKQNQVKLNKELNYLRDQLSQIKVINDINLNYIIFGAFVKLQYPSGKIKVLQIVGEYELQLDKDEKKISIYAPLSRKLIGKKKGDIVEVNIENTITKYKILDFYYRDKD